MGQGRRGAWWHTCDRAEEDLRAVTYEPDGAWVAGLGFVWVGPGMGGGVKAWDGTWCVVGVLNGHWCGQAWGTQKCACSSCGSGSCCHRHGWLRGAWAKLLVLAWQGRLCTSSSQSAAHTRGKPAHERIRCRGVPAAGGAPAAVAGGAAGAEPCRGDPLGRAGGPDRQGIPQLRGGHLPAAAAARAAAPAAGGRGACSSCCRRSGAGGVICRAHGAVHAAPVSGRVIKLTSHTCSLSLCLLLSIFNLMVTSGLLSFL